MSRELYQARSKKTVKMGRDGLVETDRATGEERRVSQKETEVSFGTGHGSDEYRNSGVTRESARDTAGKGAKRVPESDRVPETGRVPAGRVTDQPMDRVQGRVAVGRGADHGAVGRADRVTDHVPAGRVADRVPGKDAQPAPPEHGPQSRTARKQQQRQKMQERMAREAQTGTADGGWITDYLPDFAAPDEGPEDAVLPDVSLPDVTTQDAAAAMRGAADMPMFVPPPSAADAPKPDGGRAGKRRLKGTEKGGKRLGRDGGERLKPDGKEKENPEGRGRTGLRGPGDVRLAAREERRPGEGRLKGGDRLRFGEARGREAAKPDPREKLKKRQTKQLAADAAKPEIPDAAALSPVSAGRERPVSKLRFQKEREPVADGEENREQAGETAAADGVLAASVLARAAARLKRPAKKREPDGGRLQFDRDRGGREKDRTDSGTGARRQRTRSTTDAAKPGAAETENAPADVPHEGRAFTAGTDAPSPARRPSDRGTGPRLRFGDRAGRERAGQERANREDRQPDSGTREKQRQTEKFAPDAAKAGAAETENAPTDVPHEGRASPAGQDVSPAPSPARRPSDRESGPRLRFGDRAGRERADREDRQPDSGAGEKQRQTERFTPDAAKAGAAETENAPAENVPHEARTSHDGTDTPSPLRRPSEGQTGPRLHFEELENQDTAANQSGTVERERPRQARRFAPEAAKRETENPEEPRRMDGGKTVPAPAPSPAPSSATSGPDSSVVPPVPERSSSGQTRHEAGQGDRPRLRFEKETEAPSQQHQPEQREKNRRAGRFAPEAGKRGDREAGDKKPDSVTREKHAAAQRETPEPSKTETAAKAAVAVTEQAEHTRYGRGRGDAPPASPAASPVHEPATSPAQGSARSGQRLRFEKETGQTERGPGRDSPQNMATRSEAEPENKNRETAGRPTAKTTVETTPKTGQRYGQEYGPERPRQNRENGPKEPDGDGKERQIPPDTPCQERTRLRFEDESRETERDRKEKERGTERETERTTEREAEKNSSSETIERGGEAEAVPSREPPKPADAPTTQKRSRLRFEDAPPQARPAPDAPSNTPANASSGEKKEKPTREQWQYEKGERRVEQASRKLKKAQSKIPVARRLRLEREYDGASGKYRHRLRFETEPVPEGVPTGGPLNAAAFTVRSAVALKIHGKLREVERDNVSVEAAHRGEFLAEQGGGAFLRWNHARLRAKPYRAVRLAERKLEREKVNLEWKKFLRDNPELRRKNIISKWIQKQKIKRKYAAAAHEAKQVEQQTRHIVNATGQIARAMAQFIAAKKSLLATVALLGLIVLLFSTGLVSCTAMLSGFQSSYISVSYMADEEDITQADLYYTEMETDLQIDIDNTEINYPGYDEYRYNVGEIAHNPFELLSYLSTRYNAFKFSAIKSDIEALFWQQYTLTRTVVVETRYDSEDEPYDWYVLVTTLSVRPLSSIASANLDAGEEMTRYSLYLQTYGDRQAYGNPFDFPWLGRVSSLFGYRKHPMTGAKNYHHGVDIGAPEGTEIKAIQDGRVVTAEELDSYGLCVVIENEKGYSSRYAHCSRLDVHAGQRVKRGDVIAAVGSTGDSTGPHLHLETKLNGEYLNPLFFVETGGSGGGAVPGGGVVIPDYPGEAPTDETFARMLEEAEKYLGYPYVWGGSSPSTSFDCSGYVSWVINHSGWNVGRLGAQALCNLCTPVSPADARPGDLVFFRYTYNAPIRDGVTHVGIYVGNDTMIHCGSPISYANLNTSYWQSHFYLFGRLPPPTN